MNLSRREFSLLGAAGLITLAGGAALPRLARAALASKGLRFGAQTYFKWQPVGSAGSAAAAFGEGGNTLVVWSKNELLLVDTKNCPFGLPLRREALAGSGAPAGAALKQVVNTHHHGDHTGGNFAFTRDVPVLAHEKAKARVLQQIDRYTGAIKGAVAQMGRSDNPAAKDLLTEFGELADKVDQIKAEQFAPTESMGSEKELKVGDVKVVLRHVGAGHTDNDVFLFFPDLNV